MMSDIFSTLAYYGIVYGLATLRPNPTTLRGRPSPARIARIPHSQRPAVLLDHQLHPPNFPHG